jgi:MoxR-like ATPase
MNAPASPEGAGPAPVTPADVEAMAEARERVLGELRKRIIGQDAVVELLLIALFARGHGLFIGVPGLAKTLLISTLADALSLGFNRIQFTPDLMPSDITGTDVLEEDHATGKRFFKFIEGPIFTNILLADEINRTPPKTQAALLQAMQEHRVTAGGTTYKLPPPFLVFATQNPIEQEGTYPLPEAQLDRFMFSIAVDYPTFDEEVAIVTRTTGQAQEEVKPVLGAEDLARFQDVVLGINAAPALVRYAVEVATRTRPVTAAAPRMVKDYVAWGAGPRASQYLILGAKARAALLGRTHVSHDDIDALAPAVLGHRVLVNFQAEAERIGARDVVAEVLRSASSSR